MKLSEYPNEAIEAAAVSAETWDNDKYGDCRNKYVSDCGFGWPAVKLSQFEGSHDEAVGNNSVAAALTAISNEVDKSGATYRYLYMIDRGQGSEVAAIIRSHKTPTK